MEKSSLFIAFACDTEDNHPNYIPGWEKYGSCYNHNPATLKWNWTNYWSDLCACFDKKDAPVTWLIRVDDGPVYDNMLKLYHNEILDLQSKGDEIGIHIHTWHWSKPLQMWTQTTNSKDEARIVFNSLTTFKKHLGFAPLSARMGWTAMSNTIMNALNSNGIIAEASATPGQVSSGKFEKRDNIFDWSRVPTSPYHPDCSDYQSSGNMAILEMPISSIGSNKVSTFGKLVNKLSGKKALFKLVPIAKWLRLTPHNSFYITPWWSSTVYRKLINEYANRAKTNGASYLIGTFHPCDILNPKTGGKSLAFENCLSEILEDIASLKDVNIHFVSLSEMAQVILPSINRGGSKISEV